MALTPVSYRSWQAIVCLPALVLIAYFADQRIDLHRRQIKAWIDGLYRFGASAQSRLLQQLAEDAIEEGPAYVTHNAAKVLPQLSSALRHSINMARSELTPDEFLAWANVSARMIDTMHEVSPPWYRLGRQMVWRLRLQRPTNFVPELRLAFNRMITRA